MTTRFKPYPSYKNSGVEWLGRLPAQWQVKRLKFLASQPLAYGANESAELNDRSQPRFIRITDIKNDGTLHDDTFRSLPEEVAKPFLLKQGDLLLARSGATVGKTFMYRESWGRACHAGYLIRCRLNLAAANPEFVSYFATSATYWGWLSSVFLQATIQNVSAEKYGNLFVPVPQVEEQRTIASFLDRETGKIDALVRKQERLIELLQEKRTALISHAVTQGLNPNAPKKDSGIPWLGPIPKHWEAKPLKRSINFVEGPGIMASAFTAQGVPLLRISCVGGRRATLDGCNFVSQELATTKWSHFRVKQCDLLISGSASTGFCCEVDDETAGAIPYTGIIIIRPLPSESDRDFIRWFFLSNLFLDQSQLAKTGSTIQHFGPTHLSRMFIVLPSVPEQVAIAAYLDAETAKLDALLAKVRTAIERLLEYRTALISAAVTGQIDVCSVSTL